MSDIRTIVKQILLEELGRYDIGNTQRQRTERVDMRNSKDLNSFALKVLDMAGSRDVAAEIRSGSLKFELNNPVAVDRPMSTQYGTAPEAFFDKGLVTEKQIAKLNHNAHISVGKGVCFTPLAKDEIRLKGIKIERKSK